MGESLFWASAKLFSTAGSHILFMFLLLAGVLLLTGASIAGIVTATREAAATTTERVRRTTGDGARAVRAAAADRPAGARGPRAGGSRDARGGAGTRTSSTSTSRSLEPEYEDDEGSDPLSDARLRGSDPLESRRPTTEEPELTPMGNRRSPVTESDDIEYRMPKLSFLKRSNGAQKLDTKGIERTGAQLVEALSHFNVEARLIGTVSGPHVTRYELRLAPGIKMSKVATLKDDLAYALAAEQVRILAPIPGKQAVGVEVPNRVRTMVHLGDVFQDAPKGWSPLSVWLGKDIAGKAIGTDLAKQPHILIAGTTGSGKSGCVNSMLSSVLLHASPNEVRHGAGGPEARGAEPLRGHPAPAHAGGHLAAPGRERAQQPDQGDGGALRRDEPLQDAQPRGAEPRAHARGRGAAARTSCA